MEIATLSPNQLAKRQQMIEEAKSVLVEHGLNGFTTRRLAENGSFSRGAIHYYFDSVEQIIDAAMTSNLETFVDSLRAAASDHEDPLERFWAVIDAYLEYFASRPELALLWFDYAITAVQAGRPQRAIDIEVALRDLLREFLGECSVPDTDSRAEALLAFMLGTTLRGVLHPAAPVSDVHQQLRLLSGLV